MDKSIIWGLVRMVLVLAIIIPGVYYVTRWYGKKQVTGQNLKIKEALSVGSSRALYVVEWKDKEYLLGVTNQAIALLDQDSNARCKVEEDQK